MKIKKIFILAIPISILFICSMAISYKCSNPFLSKAESEQTDATSTMSSISLSSKNFIGIQAAQQLLPDQTIEKSNFYIEYEISERRIHPITGLISVERFNPLTGEHQISYDEGYTWKTLPTETKSN